MKIEVKHKDVYGNDLMYVCDPRIAQLISRLTGKRTVDKKDLEILAEMGNEIIDLDLVLRSMFN